MKVDATQTRLLLLAIAVAGVTVWSYKWLGRYQPFADLMHPQANPMGQLELQVSDATVTGRTGGKVRWRVRARTISVSRDQFTVTAEGVHDGFFYDASERPIVRMSAPHASYQSPGGLLGTTAFSVMRLSGGVQARVLSPNGPEFRTQDLVWDERNHLVQSPGQATAVFPNGAGSASGSDIRFDTNTYNLSLRRLHGTFRIGRLVN